MITFMAQPHKGERTLIASRPPQAVYEEIRRRAYDAGISMSQFVADVLCREVDRDDLVRELHRRPQQGRLAM